MSTTSKTQELRKVIQAQLATLTGGTYYRFAPDNVAFPYKTFELQRAALGDLSRDDIDLCVDVWDRAANSKTVEAIADAAEDLFNAANLPQTTILPTIFRESRYPVTDEDKLIQHIQMHFTVQNYVI